MATFMNILCLILLTVTENSALKLLFYLFIYLGFSLSLRLCICLLIWATHSFVRSNLFTWFSSCIYVFTFIYLKIDVCLFSSYVGLFFIHFIFRLPYFVSRSIVRIGVIVSFIFFYCSMFVVVVVVAAAADAVILSLFILFSFILWYAQTMNPTFPWGMAMIAEQTTRAEKLARITMTTTATTKVAKEYDLNVKYKWIYVAKSLRA